jgi:hypothetical protein
MSQRSQRAHYVVLGHGRYSRRAHYVGYGFGYCSLTLCSHSLYSLSLRSPGGEALRWARRRQDRAGGVVMLFTGFDLQRIAPA